jgi:hypothetical protein
METCSNSQEFEWMTHITSVVLVHNVCTSMNQSDSSIVKKKTVKNILPHLNPHSWRLRQNFNIPWLCTISRQNASDKSPTQPNVQDSGTLSRKRAPSPIFGNPQNRIVVELTWVAYGGDAIFCNVWDNWSNWALEGFPWHLDKISFNQFYLSYSSFLSWKRFLDLVNTAIPCILCSTGSSWSLALGRYWQPHSSC